MEKLLTNYGKVIIAISENIVKFDDKNLLPLTQKEIGDKVGLTQQTINFIFAELKKDGFLKTVGNKYFVSNKTFPIAKKLKEIQKLNC